jgi:hypothetical protein
LPPSRNSLSARTLSRLPNTSGIDFSLRGAGGGGETRWRHMDGAGGGGEMMGQQHAAKNKAAQHIRLGPFPVHSTQPRAPMRGHHPGHTSRPQEAYRPYDMGPSGLHIDVLCGKSTEHTRTEQNRSY